MNRSTFFKFFNLTAYIICVIVLIVESSMNGISSTNQSNTLGGTIANIFNDIGGDQTTAVAPTSVSITNKISTASVGDKYQLNVTTLPEDATYKSLVYLTNNEKVATVSNDGIISFLGEGMVTIEVHNTVYSELKDSITIDVKKVNATNIESVIDSTYNEDGYYTLYIGYTYNITTTFTPSNTTDKSLTYSLDNNSYLKIDENGVITPTKYSSGSLTEITITHEGLENKLKVNVEYENIKLLNSISVEDMSVYVTESAALKLSFNPSDATFKDYTLTSSDTSVASISGTKVVGRKVGTATIEIVSKTYSNIKTTCLVTVNPQPKMESYIALVSETLTIGSSKTISISNVTPKYADISNKSFTSSDSNIASVTSSGKITANSVGNCSISVKIDDMTQTLNINVVNKLDEDTTDFDIKTNEIYGENLHLLTNENYTICSTDEKALFSISNWYPTKPSVTDLSYELSDPTFGTVSKNSIIFSKPGKVELIITHEPSGIVKNISLEIAIPYSLLNLAKDEIDTLNLNVNGIAYFSIKDNQNEEINQTYEIHVENSDVIALNYENGTYDLFGLNEGQTKITIIPYIDDEMYDYYKKEIIINCKHVLSSGISVFLLNNDTNNFVELEEYEINMNMLNNYSLDVKHYNEPTTSSIKYQSMNEAILKIENDGKIVPISAGSTKIIITEEKSNLSKEIKVNITNYIAFDEENSFTINGMNLSYDEETKIYSLTNGFSGTFKVNFDSKSTYTAVSYYSSDSSVATIGEDGTITPFKAGITEITAVCDDGITNPITFTIKLEVKRQDFIKDLDAFFKFVRKGIGHYGAFLVLGIFSTLTWLSFMDKKKMFASVPINFFSGFFVAALTEFIQAMVPGRGPSFNDIMLDFYGFLTSSIVITIVLVVLEIVIYKKSKKEKNKNSEK